MGLFSWFRQTGPSMQEFEDLKQRADSLENQLALEKALKISTTKVQDFKFKEYDPQAMVNQLISTSLRPSGISNETLRLLSFKSTLISSIIRRRKSQLECFGYRQKTQYDLGWKIVPKDPTKEITRSVIRDIDKLSEGIDNLGFIGYDPMRGSFKDFLGLIIQDSLIFDGAAIETVRARDGKPAAFKAIDGGSIIPRWDETKGRFNFEEYIQDTLVRTYDPSQVIYAVRNKTTDRRWLGFGVSETETLLSTITAHLFAEEYNKRLFKNGHFLSGIVSLKGTISREQFEEFKRDFYSFVTGVENTNRVAIVNAPQGVEFMNSIKSPQEMGFQTFLDYSVKVASSIFMMDPVEINFFVNGNTGQQSANPSSMSAQEFRIKYSKDAGLRPLMTFIEEIINRNFVSQWSDSLEFRFFGLDVDSKKERQNYLILSKKYKTLNEIRREEGLPDLEGDLGQCIEDSGYTQLLLKNAQAQQQGGEMGGGDESPAYDETQYAIIENYMKDNGYTDSDIQIVLDSFTSGLLSFDDFKSSTGTTDEDLEQYKPQETPPEETPGDELPPETLEEEVPPEELEETPSEENNE